MTPRTTDRAARGHSLSMAPRTASHALLALLATLAAVTAGCNYRVTVGAHDGGGPPPACGSDGECPADQQCVCARCVARDVMTPACDPPCGAARDGDLCTVEGRRCERGCTSLACVEGVFRTQMGSCADAGWCECPPPPPGCRYDGSPCPCDHLTCGGERCGRAVCGEGTTCCNASCGVCVPPGGACTDVECAVDCRPQDAYGAGPCTASLGAFAWNGVECAELHGCECIGSECAATFASHMQCVAFFESCGRTCGGRAGAVCNPGEYCDFPEPHYCGGADETGVCRTRPDACPPEIRTVCGCDGVTYASPCDAYTSGTDVARDGACDATCSAQDARGSGSCDLFLGYAWTGSGCTGLSGCSCAGADCGSLYASESDCLDAHAGCPIPLGG